MSVEPRWNSQDPLRPAPSAQDDDVSFADITARLEKAGWITDPIETNEGLSMDWTPLGRDRLRSLVEIARPMIARLRDKSAPTVSIERQAECMTRLVPFIQESMPPALDEMELQKLVVLVARYGPE
jgi:hypothetical protein